MEAKDVTRIKDGLNSNKESESSSTNKIEVMEVAKSDYQTSESNKNNPPVIEKKVDLATRYDKRKISFEKWSNDSGVTLESYSKESVFKMLANATKNESLWKISFETYKREFYQRYSQEIDLKKSSGAPPRRK